MSHATAVFNSGMIVFREGLEAILIFAAVTASFLGANKSKRRPVVAGAGVAFAVTIASWFVIQAVLDAASPLGPKLEAITGFLAIVVLLVVLNWFVHRVYWTDWIGRHHKRRQKLLTQTGAIAVAGLVERVKDPEDGRASILTATTEGRALLRRLRERKTAYLAKRLGVMDAEDRRTLERAAELLEGMLE